MNSYSQVQLTTLRLKLRPLNREDENRLFRIHSDAEFMRFWSSPPWTEVEQAKALIARDQVEMMEGRNIRLGIFLQQEEVLVGTCALFRLDGQCRRAELGYGISRDCWRMGYMLEAVTALLDFGFNEIDLNRVEADVDPRNLASCKSLEKLGFLREGLLRERWIVGEEVSDSALYGLLASDWQQRAPNRNASASG